MSTSRIWQLAARKLTHDITLEELQELEQLLKDDPALASKLDLHQQCFNTTAEHPGHEDGHSRKAWQKQLQLMAAEFPDDFAAQPPPSPMRKRRTMLYAALSILVLVPAGLLAWYLLQSGNRQPAVAEATTIEALDKKHEMTLPDGTRAILNKNSHIHLNEGFGQTNRTLALEGEAFFDVAHDASLPMIIQAASVQVRVMGTAFNVRAYKNEKLVTASLIRGSIEVTDKANEQMKLVLKPNDKVTIRLEPLPPAGMPEQKKTEHYYKVESLKKEELNEIVQELTPVVQKLTFESEPLEQVVEKLEKWYHVSITVQDEKLKKEKFTGEFEKEDISEALTALQITYPFHFTIQADGKILITR